MKIKEEILVDMLYLPATSDKSIRCEVKLIFSSYSDYEPFLTTRYFFREQLSYFSHLIKQLMQLIHISDFNYFIWSSIYICEPPKKEEL